MSALALVAILLGACGDKSPSSAPRPPSADASGVASQPSTTASPDGTTGPPPTPGPPSAQAGLILSEVRFAPSAGDAAFVEIANGAASPIDAAGAKLRVDGTDAPLSDVSLPVAPGAQLVVSFDTPGSTDHPGIHAPSGLSLAAGGGTVELLDGGGQVLDRVAWGNKPYAVRLSAGALTPDTIEPGTTIGREPGATTPGQPWEWTVFAPGSASPGRANPMPPVGVLLPLSGSVLQGADQTLAWYPVSGAASYHVQVSTDPAFGSTVLDTTTTDPQLAIGTLAPGEYVWRVLATDAARAASAFSEPSTFELRAPIALAMAARGSVDVASRVLAFVDEPGKQLTVPLLSQRKDTAMLLLEEDADTGAHAWDNDHGALDPKDPADNMNCAQASVAMVNQFFGGDLSQDRLGYELYKVRSPGIPEEDLNHGSGFTQADVTKLLTFALGAPPDHGDTGQTPDEVWAEVTASIDAGRPVVVAGLKHVFVFTGYEISGGKRLFDVNDPWNYAGHGGTGRYDIDANAGRSAAVLDTWILPAGASGTHQEPGVVADSDSDGVVDFDEAQRFHLNPTNKDTDGDKVPDKQDIASGVFDTTYGYAAHPNGANPGRDFDGDGKPTEVDPDSDGGGCQDGREDTNFDGHRTEGETWNFDPNDDKCFGWRGTMTGTYEWHLSTSQTTGKGTATFTGLWEPVPADQPPVSCATSIPGSCLGYYPTGTISWTWDAHRPGCDETQKGDVPAGAVNDPRNAGGANGVPLGTQVLILVPDGAGKFGYFGAGTWALPAPMKCDDGIHSVRHPPAYFGLDQDDSGDGTPDGTGNSCAHTTWQIDTTATSIKGSCFDWNNSGSSSKIEWDLTRVGPAPGSQSVPGP